MLESEKGSKGSLLGAIGLIAGTCVGGGMLALPLDTANIGFYPSLLVLFISWIFMMLTGLLLVEANLWFKDGAHFDTMARKLLGRPGEVVSIVVFLFMGYASLVAYNIAGGALIHKLFEKLGYLFFTAPVSSCLFAILFGSILFLGTRVLGAINTILFFAMIAAYVALIGMGVGQVSDLLLSVGKWTGLGFTLPLILASFSFQMIVPSLTPYLKYNRRQLNIAVVIGSFIPFLVYALWLWVMLGTVPAEGPHGLVETMQSGLPATYALQYFVKNPGVVLVAQYFAFFALVTSYLGISLSTFDFLSDLLKMKEKGYRVLVLVLCVLVPTLVFTLQYPTLFLEALEISGGFGDAIISGMLPVLMVASGRYYYKKSDKGRVFGGVVLLGALFLFALYVFCIQVIKLF
ncbi:MAG: Tyrosine-specific transport protein [Chlamydiia bacterium]|nr:Tyrosine-specific transport protein [Chlamydiia bacterium]